jgi:hypothetical protein
VKLDVHLNLGMALWTMVTAAATPAAGYAQAEGPAPVQVQMGNVDFHVDPTIVLRIRYLRGELRRTDLEHPAYLDDKLSFTLAIDSARIGITPAGLSDLLNHYTFAYPGSPLRKLEITIEQGRLKQHGLMRGISFTMLGELSVTPEGELRLHPTSIKAVGIGVGGLMKFFGLHLKELVNTSKARGARIDGNDFLLSPAQLLPPPAIKGQLSAVQVDSEIVQIFRPPHGQAAKPLALPDPKAANYMFFKGGTLRFGKLTMADTDLMIMDADTRDPFDFFLDHYNEQLVAGYSRNTRDHGLLVVMPDYRNTVATRGSIPPPSIPHRPAH